MLSRTLSLKELRYPITSIIIKRSVIFNHISVINYYTFIVPKRILKNKTIMVVSNQAHLRRIGMELKKHLISNCCNIIYKYPKNELVSFENMKKNEKVRNMLINQVIKIVDYVNEGKLQDEDIKWSSVK